MTRIIPGVQVTVIKEVVPRQLAPAGVLGLIGLVAPAREGVKRKTIERIGNWAGFRELYGRASALAMPEAQGALQNGIFELVAVEVESAVAVSASATFQHAGADYLTVACRARGTAANGLELVLSTQRSQGVAQGYELRVRAANEDLEVHRNLSPFPGNPKWFGQVLSDSDSVLDIQPPLFTYADYATPVTISAGDETTVATLGTGAGAIDVCVIAVEPGGKALQLETADGYDLRLMSVDAPEDLEDEGNSLVVVALVGTDLHIRIFDANGKKVVDKAEDDLTPGEALTALKERLSPLTDESSLSQADKQEIIGYATSSAGHTPADDQLTVTHDPTGTPETLLSMPANDPELVTRLREALEDVEGLDVRVTIPEVAIIQTLTGGQDASVAEYTAGIGKLVDVPDVDLVVASLQELTVERGAAVYGAIIAHCESMSADAKGRIGFGQVPASGTLESHIDMLGPLVSDRFVLFAPHGVLGAAVGRIGSLDYYRSPTFKSLAGLGVIEPALTVEQQRSYLRANIVPVAELHGRGNVVIRGLTADGDQISVRRVADRAVRGVKQIGELFIGKLNTEDGRNALRQKINEFLLQMQAENAIVPSTDGSDPAFKLDVYSSQADFAMGIVRVDIAVRPVRAIDYIYATILVQA